MEPFQGAPEVTATLDDGQIAAIKARCYRGVARVKIHSLSFNSPLVQKQHRELSQKNVDRLVKIFGQVGCLRLQQENFVNAIIDDSTLEQSLARSGLSLRTFAETREGEVLPLLEFPNIDCLSGLHRIQAASQYLDDNDQWWVVRFFSAVTPSEILCRAIESYSNEEKPPDGEIFRKIRLYHITKDEVSENRWWACLDKSKPKDLRQLLKKKRLASRFDRLVELPGLWTRVQLGALHRLLALKCDEEMENYLNHIHTVWEHILSGHNALCGSIVDTATAEALQALSPNDSADDRDTITRLMANGDIFASLLDQTARDILLSNILTLPSACLIPTLWTFFESLKYLEPCCDILKQLIGIKMKGTIRSSLQACFWIPERNMVQISEHFESELTVNIDQPRASWLAYVQLWAFCARHFDALTSMTPRKEAGRLKPVAKKPNPVLWQHLARFAISLGFRTPKVLELAAHGAEFRSQLAKEYLGRAYPMLSTFTDKQIADVVSCGAHISENSPLTVLPGSEDIEPERRYGRPFEDDLSRDKARLFIPYIYTDETFLGVTVDCVRNNLFTYFFGSFKVKNESLGPPQPAAFLAASTSGVEGENMSLEQSDDFDMEDTTEDDLLPGNLEIGQGPLRKLLAAPKEDSTHQQEMIEKLEESLRTAHEQMRKMEQEARTWTAGHQETNRNLEQSLHVAQDTNQKLEQNLCATEERMRKMEQEARTWTAGYQETNRNLEQSLHVAHDTNRKLEQSLRAAEERIQTMKQEAQPLVRTEEAYKAKMQKQLTRTRQKTQHRKQMLALEAAPESAVPESAMIVAPKNAIIAASSTAITVAPTTQISADMSPSEFQQHLERLGSGFMKYALITYNNRYSEHKGGLFIIKGPMSRGCYLPIHQDEQIGQKQIRTVLSEINLYEAAIKDKAKAMVESRWVQMHVADLYGAATFATGTVIGPAKYLEKLQCKRAEDVIGFTEEEL